MGGELRRLRQIRDNYLIAAKRESLSSCSTLSLDIRTVRGVYIVKLESKRSRIFWDRAVHHVAVSEGRTDVCAEEEGTGWDGIGWDRMGWDGMGWDGTGWEGILSHLLGQIRSRFRVNRLPVS